MCPVSAPNAARVLVHEGAGGKTRGVSQMRFGRRLITMLSFAASVWLLAGCVRIPIRELSPPDGRVYGQRVGPIFDIRNACSDGGPLTGSLTEQNVHSMIGDADRRYSVKCGFLEASKSCTREEFDFRGSAIYLDILYGGLLNTEVQSTLYSQ